MAASTPIAVDRMAVMLACMSRPRITADVAEEVRRALLIYAAETDVSVGELIERMARDYMPEHIERAKQIIEKNPPLKRSGPKPKKPS